MNPSTHPNSAAEEQASLWAARLDGSALSANQRLALDAWLAADPAHRALLSHYCQFSADLEQQMPLLAGIRELSAEVQPSLATARPHPWSRWPMTASVALTAAAAVALVFWLARPASQFENLATPVAQRRALTLADGTRVELNARTSLQVDIDGSRRHVRLATGEAFFAVRKDPSRPFIVETPAGSVRVTGTQFNVRADSRTSLEVTVTEGSVQARPGDTGGQAATPVALSAGDQFNARDGVVSVQALSPVALDHALAWRQGQTVFASVLLHEALAQFARYHGRKITVTPEAASLRIGGRFNLGDLDGFLAALQELLPVKVTHLPDGSVLVELRPER